MCLTTKDKEFLLDLLKKSDSLKDIKLALETMIILEGFPKDESAESV